MGTKLSNIIIFGFVLIVSAATVIEADEQADNVETANFHNNDVEDEENISVVEEEENDDNNNEYHIYESPTIDENQFYFTEHFDNPDEFTKNWIKSNAKKDDIAEEIAKYDGEWKIETPIKQIWKNDLGLVLKTVAKHAAIASRLNKPFIFKDKPFIVQYEVTLQDGQQCGGSYIKLLSKGFNDLTKFNDKTPYTIMFGPDKCGNDVSLHFIFRHVNPKNGSITEKHCKKPRERLDEHFKDKLPHLYQLLINPDNTFEIRADHRVVNEGSLLTDFNPSVNPPKDIDDPTDSKPSDWDEREKIPDPTAIKPDDWDEEAPPQIPDPNETKPDGWLDNEEPMIPDMNAIKPDDWDNSIDGEWEPPLIENPICNDVAGCGPWKATLITNPNFKGKWSPPMIDNPEYRGKWMPRKIPNPDFFEDLKPFKMTPIDAIGIEIWSMSSDILFDNIIITDNMDIANEWAAKTFDLKKRKLDKDSDSMIGSLLKYTADKPWLWGVYIGIVAVPLVLFLYIFCSSKEKDDSAKAKKTDEQTPMDDEVKNNSHESDETQERLSPRIDKGDSSPKGKKSDLDINKDAGGSNKSDSGGEEEKLTDDEVKQPNEMFEDTMQSSSVAEGTRRRKPRKE